MLTQTATRLTGESDDLSRYRGKVVLIVNTATECGFTYQLQGLQDLYAAKKDAGLVVLGFPSNEFAAQEPRSEDEIGEFCQRNYGVEFPMFAKVTVKGEDAHPLFKELPEPTWNFNKFLIDREGTLVRRWHADTKPDDPEFLAAIDELL